MRLRNIPGADEKLNSSPYVVNEPDLYKGNWKKEIYHNDHPLCLEIGCGKGMFLTTLSERNPDINYLGVEKMSSVLLRAVQKREEIEEERSLYFVRFDAEEINTIFDAGEVDRLYLNFSDPWPKDRHHKRRLTSREFLKRYEHILSPDAVIEFKTDNTDLFDFSVTEAEEAGWEILLITRDLHHSEYNEGNVMTEYEDRFSTLGNKICKLVMRPKK